MGLAGFEPATHAAGKELTPHPSRWQSGVRPHISRVLHHAELQAHFARTRSLQVCLKICLLCRWPYPKWFSFKHWSETYRETAISRHATSLLTIRWAGSSAWYAHRRGRRTSGSQGIARATGRSRVRIPPGPPNLTQNLTLSLSEKFLREEP